MQPETRAGAAILAGPAAGALFVVGIVVLGTLVPGYSQVRQTVSEIGELDSPMRWPFAALLCAIALCLFVFASAIHARSRRAHRSGAPAYVIVCMGLSAAGVGLFAFPHPLHNVFGMSELIGYQAPLALALTWRGVPWARPVVRTSWIFWALVLLAIAANLGSLARGSALWALERPCYGLIQRSLFLAWFGWAAVIGLQLRRAPRLEP